MTENEKYTVKKWYNESAIYEDGELFAIVDVRMQAKKIAHRLNEQDNEIQRCKLAYNQLTSYVDANFDEYMTQKKLNERIQELETELNAFKPVVFQDMRKGTILLYAKDYCGDVE